MLVLIGVMEVNGFLLKQERRFRALYSPSNSSHLTLTALDISCEGLPCNKSALLDGAKSSRFYPASQQATPTTDEMRVDLEPVDAERLNAMIAGGGWTDVSLVVLLRGIDSTLTRCLEAQDGALPSFVSRPFFCVVCVCVCVCGVCMCVCVVISLCCYIPDPGWNITYKKI